MEIKFKDKKTGRTYVYDGNSGFSSPGLGCQLGTLSNVRVIVIKVLDAEGNKIGQYAPPTDVKLDAIKAAHAHPEIFEPFYQYVLKDLETRCAGAVIVSAPINLGNVERGQTNPIYMNVFDTMHFIKWVRDTGAAVCVASPVFLNPAHKTKTDTSLCQVWIIINPKYEKGAHLHGPTMTGRSRMAKTVAAGQTWLTKLLKGHDLTKTVYFKTGGTSV